MDFINSQIGANDFDSVKFRLDIKLDNKLRSVSLNSDILDFNLNGEYNFGEAYALFNHQVNKISYSISNKLKALNPLVYSPDNIATLNELKRNEFIVYCICSEE